MFLQKKRTYNRRCSFNSKQLSDICNMLKQTATKKVVSRNLHMLCIATHPNTEKTERAYARNNKGTHVAELWIDIVNENINYEEVLQEDIPSNYKNTRSQMRVMNSYSPIDCEGHEWNTSKRTLYEPHHAGRSIWQEKYKHRQIKTLSCTKPPSRHGSRARK